jgi:fucose permease
MRFACSFPVLINATAAVLDPKLTGGAVGYISALGQCGSALFPFITGALAGSFGVISLQPLSVALMGSLVILWLIVLWISRHRWQRAHRF